jgi:cell division septation protein DedD
MIKMKKFFLGLTIVLLVSSLVIVSFVCFGAAQISGTKVSGVISSDTTWTKANSPYLLTGNVFVNSGVTLTIQAGATVYLNDNSLTINGTLIARGTTDNQINFVSSPTMWSNEGVIVFLPGSTSWNQQTQTGSIIENSIINASQPFPTIYIDTTSPKINNCLIANLGPTFNGFSGAIAIYSQVNSTTIASPTISNCTIGNMLYGISDDNGNATIAGNRVYDCSTAIESSANDTVTNNLIINNGLGLSVGTIETNQTVKIQNNTIVDNEFGFSISMSDFPSFPPIQNTNYSHPTLNGFIFNNIENNIDNEVSLASSNDTVNAGYNWWGTTDLQAINETINNGVLSYYNGNGNYYSPGTFNILPLLTAPNPDAPLLTYNPSPLPTPTATPTPTASPTPSSTPTATPAPTINSNPTNSPTSTAKPITSPTSSATPSSSPSTSPTAPEFPLITIAIAALIAATLTGALLTKKGKK